MSAERAPCTSLRAPPDQQGCPRPWAKGVPFSSPSRNCSWFAVGETEAQRLPRDASAVSGRARIQISGHWQLASGPQDISANVQVLPPRSFCEGQSSSLVVSCTRGEGRRPAHTPSLRGVESAEVWLLVVAALGFEPRLARSRASCFPTRRPMRGVLSSG